MKMRAKSTDEWKNIGTVDEVQSFLKSKLGRGIVFRTTDGVEIFMSQKEIDSWAGPPEQQTFPRF